MLMPAIAIVVGLLVLVWSADRFVDGAASVARHLGLSPLFIGMVIIGFGTSAPEMVVSAFAALQGNPGIALGNAYGSNITNIALILGLTAVMRPITVKSTVLRRELPVLVAITAVAALQLGDGFLSRTDALILLGLFLASMVWSGLQSRHPEADALQESMQDELESHPLPMRKALVYLLVGLVLLVISSRILVWGAVSVAQGLGVSDLVIGLTIVAVGTSLPELASAIAATRKNQHDLALGNIIGSNIFNTLAVVGIAAGIHPLEVSADVLNRDMLVMALLTLSLFVFGYGFRGPGRINRIEGSALLAAYFAYTGYLLLTAF